MEFKKERVYSAVNADELKPGDKVIVADNLVDLKEFVRKNDVHEIEDILSEKCSERFGVCGMANYALAYLVERKENCTNCALKNSMQSCRIALSVLHKCKDYKPKTEPKAEKDCDNCGQRCDGYGKGEVCSQWIPKAEKHTDYNRCEDCKKAYTDYPCVANAYHDATGRACENFEAEPHYRPFRDTDELIKAWIAERMVTYPDLCMPHIWVRQKECSKGGLLITYFGEDEVKTDMGFMTMNKLLSDYTFTDGSPCGVEE